MSKSSSIYTRVDPDLKERVERVLLRLGLPMASAINLYLHQIDIHNGIPFDLKLPSNNPLDYSMLTKAQFDEEMEKAQADVDAGRTIQSSLVRENMHL